jgi:hypothetical protein
MKKYDKDPEAIARLTPEQYRVTQHSDTSLMMAQPSLAVFATASTPRRFGSFL